MCEGEKTTRAETLRRRVNKENRKRSFSKTLCEIIQMAIGEVNV